MSSFLSREELMQMGFKSVGEDVLISRYARFYGAGNMTIGNHVRIDDFCILSGKIELGNYIHIAAYSALYAGHEGIKMNNFSGLSSRVTIYAASDDYSGEFLTNPTVPEKYTNVSGGKVTLKKHVIVGSSTVILPNVILEEGAAVGSCSMVAKNCDAWKIYAGVPARCIKERSKKLLELERKLDNEV